MYFRNIANVLSVPNVNLNIWPRKVGKHDDYLQQLSHGGKPSIALRDFILQSFSIIDFISPKTITKNVCVRNVLGKALLNPGYTANFRMGWKTCPQDCSKQTITNKNIQMTRFEKNKKKFQKETKKEGVIIYVLNLLWQIFPSWFSILNNLLIMNFLIGSMKDFVLRFFTAFPFSTPWNYPVTFGFLMFSGSIKGKYWEETSQAF